MPIWLRKLTYNQILNFRQLEAEAVKPKSQKGQSQIDLSKPKEAKQILQQAGTPTYTSKASKK
jgi:hypothetical protein